MPELPEVETIMRAMHARLHGQTIDRIVLHRPDLRWPMPSALGHALEGQTITRFARRSKYILMRTSGGLTMLWHLGMSGRIDLSDGADTDPRKPHEHVVLTTQEGARCGLVDPRRFGAVDLVRTQDEGGHKLLSALGIEPLSPEFGATRLEGLLAGRRTPIKTALLDQKLIAGLGNIYVCEALYRARIHPERRACDLTGDEIAGIAAAIPPVLNAAIAAGGSSLRDYRHPDGELGYFQAAWAVYGREGEGCPDCKKPPCPGVRRITQGGRSTFYCPRQQKTPV